MYLVGDIGGTKTHLAYFHQDRLIKEEKFPSQHYSHLNEILNKFIDQPAEKTCLAIAGPIQDRMCRMTNLKWEIDANEIEKEFRVGSVHLINDLVASGWGLKRLQPKDFLILNEGIKKSGNQAIMAAGTGLGIGGLCWNGTDHVPFASEGGHIDFAPRDVNERQFWDYLHKKYGHVSVERVISGPGLEHLYWFLVEKGRTKKGLQGEEVARQIIEQAVAGECKICQEALVWFSSLYGAAAGNLALQFLSTSGLYLAGGIAPKISSILKQGEFMKSFIDKGRFKQLLEQIPVHIVLNESLPLLGALEFCLR